MRIYYIILFVIFIAATSCEKTDFTDHLPTEETELNDELQLRASNYEETSKKFGQIFRWKFFIQNNIWGSNGPQTAWVKDINNWGFKNASLGSGNQVKSYPGIVIGEHYGSTPIMDNAYGLPKKVKNLNNMWSEWKQTNNLTAGCASYDIWFHPTASHGMKEAKYEIMIWSFRKNQHPIGTYQATKWFNNKNYDVYKGQNGNGTNVYTFIQKDNSGYLKGNIKPFVDYCVSKKWLYKELYLTSVQAGWEVIRGSKGQTTKFNLGAL